MGRAASKSYFQDSSLHSADISTACWCLSFHLCTTLSCPLHQVKNKQTNKTKKPPTKTRNKQKKPNKPSAFVYSNICCGSMTREGRGDFSVWWESCRPRFWSLFSVGERYVSRQQWSGVHPHVGSPKGQAAPISSSSSAEKLGMFPVCSQGVAPFLGAVFLEEEWPELLSLRVFGAPSEGKCLTSAQRAGFTFLLSLFSVSIWKQGWFQAWKEWWKGRCRKES